MSILSSVLVLGALGLIFGMVLAYASKKFAVEVDERVEAILEILPGANCGGCGFPGCTGLANAIVEGYADLNSCPVGGSDCASKIGEIMGISSESEERQVAKILCKGNCQSAKNKYEYEGIDDCIMAAQLAGASSKACAYGCMGLGSCVITRTKSFSSLNLERLFSLPPVVMVISHRYDKSGSSAGVTLGEIRKVVPFATSIFPSASPLVASITTVSVMAPNVLLSS